MPREIEGTLETHALQDGGLFTTLTVPREACPGSAWLAPPCTLLGVSWEGYFGVDRLAERTVANPGRDGDCEDCCYRAGPGVLLEQAVPDLDCQQAALLRVRITCAHPKWKEVAGQ